MLHRWFIVFSCIVQLNLEWLVISESYSWYEAYYVVLCGYDDISFVTLYVIQA